MMPPSEMFTALKAAGLENTPDNRAYIAGLMFVKKGENSA